MLPPVLSKNDKLASQLIWLFSFIVFTAVVVLGRVKLEVDLGFDVHVFALINAVINSAVALLLIGALWAVKTGRYVAHKNMMLLAMVLSILSLLHCLIYSYSAGRPNSSFYSFYCLSCFDQRMAGT